MELQVNISPEQIETAIVQAVVDASLGATLKKEVENNVKIMTDGRGDAIKKLVEQEVRNIVIAYIQEQFTEEVKGRLRETIKNHLDRPETFDNIVTTFFTQLGQRRY